MKVTRLPNATPGDQWRLIAETDTDNEFVGEVYLSNTLKLASTVRSPNESYGDRLVGVNVRSDRQSITEPLHHAGQGLLQLLRLSSVEFAGDRHIGPFTPDPQAQEALAAVIKHVQLMLNSLGLEVVQKQGRTECVAVAHGDVSSDGRAIVSEEGGAGANTMPLPDKHAAHLALLLRSVRGAALDGNPGHYWRGHAAAIIELLDGTAAMLHKKDVDSGEDTQAGLQAAWARLPVDVKAALGAQVEQLCAAQDVQRATDVVTNAQVASAQQLEGDVVPIVQVDDDPAAPKVDVRDGAGEHGTILNPFPQPEPERRDYPDSKAHSITTWLCAAIAALLMAALPGWLDQPSPLDGPADAGRTYASYGYTSAALDEGQAELLDAQARSICAATHGPEGATVRLPDGSVRCSTKHGRSVITVLSHQAQHQHPTAGMKP